MHFSSREKDSSCKNLLSCHAVIGLRFYSPSLIPKGLRDIFHPFSNGLMHFHGYISTPMTALPFQCLHMKGTGAHQWCSAHPVPSPELQINCTFTFLLTTLHWLLQTPEKARNKNRDGAPQPGPQDAKPMCFTSHSLPALWRRPEKLKSCSSHHQTFIFSQQASIWPEGTRLDQSHADFSCQVSFYLMVWLPEVIHLQQPQLKEA